MGAKLLFHNILVLVSRGIGGMGGIGGIGHPVECLTQFTIFPIGGCCHGVPQYTGATHYTVAFQILCGAAIYCGVSVLWGIPCQHL